uniref:DUF4794 domain-containing protein n=1 Tax=Strongyloides stercoralis TaxID=6248 RepID=A0A0K0DUM4_STRER
MKSLPFLLILSLFSISYGFPISNNVDLGDLPSVDVPIYDIEVRNNSIETDFISENDSTFFTPAPLNTYTERYFNDLEIESTTKSSLNNLEIELTTKNSFNDLKNEPPTEQPLNLIKKESTTINYSREIFIQNSTEANSYITDYPNDNNITTQINASIIEVNDQHTTSKKPLTSNQVKTSTTKKTLEENESNGLLTLTKTTTFIQITTSSPKIAKSFTETVSTPNELVLTLTSELKTTQTTPKIIFQEPLTEVPNKQEISTNYKNINSDNQELTDDNNNYFEINDKININIVIQD